MTNALRVMTLNVAHGSRLPLPPALLGRRVVLRNLEAIGRVIRDAAPDVLALQEVDRAGPFAGGFDHLARIVDASALPFARHAAHGATRRLGMHHGHALLARTPLEDDADRRFACRFCHDKGFVVASVAVGGRAVDVASVHLEPFAWRTRRAQILELAAALGARRERTGRALVVMGDMNCGFEDGVALLAERLALRGFEPVNPHRTYPVLRPLVRFDWILASRELAFTRHVVLPARVSDHAPVVADLVLEP